MYEIELKARVPDRGALLLRLQEFASFSRRIKRDDTYYRIPAKPGAHTRQDENGAAYVGIRLRTEYSENAAGSETKTLLTYKRKRTGLDNAIEVNDERECELTDAAALSTFFEDAGVMPVLRKRKEVDVYECATPFGTAALEVCTVPLLGDFLEIEILSAANDAGTVCAVQAELHILLKKAGLSRALIEPRYYSELLRIRADGEMALE